MVMLDGNSDNGFIIPEFYMPFPTNTKGNIVVILHDEASRTWNDYGGRNGRHVAMGWE